MEGEFGGETPFGGESGSMAPDISIDSSPVEPPVIDDIPAEGPVVDVPPAEAPKIDELPPVQVTDQPPAETQETSESTDEQPVVNVPQEEVSVSEAASVEDSVVDDVPPDQPVVDEVQEAAPPEPPAIDDLPDGPSPVEQSSPEAEAAGEIPDEPPLVDEIPADESDITVVSDDTSIPDQTPAEVPDQEIPEEPEPAAEPGNVPDQADGYHPDPGFVPDPSDSYRPDPTVAPYPYDPNAPEPRIEPGLQDPYRSDPTIFTEPRVEPGLSDPDNHEPLIEPGPGDPNRPEQVMYDSPAFSVGESEATAMESMSLETGSEGQNWKNPRNVITPERQEDPFHSPESLPGVDPGTARKPLIDPATSPQPADPLTPTPTQPADPTTSTSTQPADSSSSTPGGGTSDSGSGAGDKPAEGDKKAGADQPAGTSDLNPEDQQFLDQLRQQREALKKEIEDDARAFENRPHLVVPPGEIPDYSKPHLVPDTVIRNLDSHLSTIKAEDIAAHEYPNTPVQELPDKNLKGVAYEGIVQNAAQDLAGSQGNVEVHPEGMTTVTGKPIEPDEIITTSDGSKVILDAKGYTLKDTQNPDAAASSLTHIDGIKNVSKYTGADVDNLNEVAVALPYETASKVNVQEAVAGMGTPDVPMTVVPISDEQTLKQTMTDLQTPPDERWDIPDDFFPKMDEIESLPLEERQQAMGDLLNSYNDSKGDASAARRNIQFYATVEPNSSGLSIVDKSGVKHTVRYK